MHPPVRASAATDRGGTRERNEDAYALLPDQGLFLVSDGMGGHQAGDLASRIVASVLPRMILERALAVGGEQVPVLSRLLREAILDLSRRLRQQAAEDPGLGGMGATVSLIWIRTGLAFVAHMGDSRAYLHRSGKLGVLTADHSVVGILLRRGEITTDEALNHPAKGRLSRYVGMEGDVDPDVRSLSVFPGDRFLLCTDGLTNSLTDPQIADVLGRENGPQAACEALVSAARGAGGGDDVTALVVELEGVTGSGE